MMKILKRLNWTVLKVSILIIVMAIIPIILIFALSNKRKPEVKGEETYKPLDFEYSLEKAEINYDFQLNKNLTSTQVEGLPTGSDIKSAVYSAGSEQGGSQNDSLPAEKKSPLQLIIPKLNISAPVILGVDGEAAIHKGAWLYPSSYEQEGEKILLGHRRYWGIDDPRSFWNLDQLVAGDTIEYVNQEGVVTKYAVKSVAIRNEGDFSVLKSSKEDLIKVISCSTADGSAGSSEKRIVVIAEKV